MIDDSYLDSAVRIRRTFMNLNIELTEYENYAKSIEKVIERALGDLEDINNSISNDKKSKNVSQEEMLKKVLDILAKLEDDSKSLESKVNPINEKIEKLRKEENQLYNVIKFKYPDIKDSELIEMVNKKLKKEGLL